MGKMMVSCSPCEDLPSPLSIQGASGVWCDLFYLFIFSSSGRLPCVFDRSSFLPQHPAWAQPQSAGSQPAHPPVHRQPAGTERHLHHHAHAHSPHRHPSSHTYPHSQAQAPPRHGLHLLPVAVAATLHPQHLRRRAASWRKQWGYSRFFCFVFFISAMNQWWISFFFYFKYVNLTRPPD